MRIVAKIADREFLFDFEQDKENETAFKIRQGDVNHTLEIIELKPDSVTMSIDNRVCFFELLREKGEIKQVAVAAHIFPVSVSTPQQAELERVLASYESSEAHSVKNRITSPMPGKILDILVKQGEKVEMGQVVAILEAMKMENEISSTIDGIVKEIKASKGDSVAIDQVLIEFQT